MTSAASIHPEDLRGQWVWLFPATYLVHIAEEYLGDFPGWVSSFGYARITPSDFLQLNALAWLLMVLGIILALITPHMRWVIISFGTIVFLNGLAHSLASIATASYSPGLISGLLLWIPLGAWTLRRARRSATRRSLLAGIVAGFLIHAVVSLLAFMGGRIPAA
ncbi:MAG TPA: HXXEE domain-containing protein [Pyrinomonadaceae bacterium]|jgi:hypothetical protein